MLTRLTTLAAAAAAVFLAACAAPSLPAGPQALAPQTFSGAGAANSAQALSLAQAFEGSAPLQALVDEVLANNRDLRAAAARVRQQQLLAEARGAERLPQLDATAGAQRQRAYTPAGTVANGNAYSVGTGAHWELDLWGRLGNAANAASQDAAATARDRDAAALSLAAQAVSLQTELIGLGHRLQLARETLTVQRQLLAIVKARVDAGRGTAADTARAESLLASTEASVPALRNAACLTRLRLDVLRGQPPADCAKADADPLPPLPAPRLVELASLPSPATLLAQRPDVQAAFARAAAQAARANQAWAARWPALSLVGNIGWSAAQTGDLFKNSSLVGNLGATLNWQWLDFGQRKAEEGAARAGYEAAVAAAEQAQLVALQDAQASLDTVRDVEQQTAFQATAAEASTRARELALKRYEAGVSDFFNLLDAERERLAAQDRLIQLQAQRAAAVVAVARAFAGGMAGGLKP
ncbi:efflux transporter outer membrane subunit [Roseateles sp.]|uniref:efflux transporter outer membrane subunit n=1 Tax=Roseateles sp. TaxID=1971397 RepID=UPI0039304712